MVSRVQAHHSGDILQIVCVPFAMNCARHTDLWYKPMTRPDDNIPYYAYVLLYVDDCMAISHKATATLQEIDKFFQMKLGSIGDLDVYLGGKLQKIRLPNRVFAWVNSSSKYVQEIVANIEKHIGQNLGGQKLSKQAKVLWLSNYTAEDDITPKLDTEWANYYQHHIGILHWMLKLGRVDIITEVSILASQMVAPHMGHLDTALHVMSYLKRKHNAHMVYDPSYPKINMSDFKTNNWTEFSGSVREPILPNAPSPRDKPVDLCMYINSDFAGDKVRRRSRTGFFVLLNSELIQWVSKQQPTIEMSGFGAEFVTMKHGVDTLRGIHYKLRMMGVPVDGPSYVYGDNMSVINNMQKPEFVLKKKSNSICYHAIRESVAMGESLTAHIATSDNYADLATKTIMNKLKRMHLVSGLLMDGYDQR